MSHEDDQDLKEISAALKAAFPPPDAGLQRDLWPAMLRRMEPPQQRVPWYDWALAATLALISFAVPKLLLLLAYHL